MDPKEQISAQDLEFLQKELESPDLTDDELAEIEAVIAEQFSPDELTDAVLNQAPPIQKPATAGIGELPVETTGTFLAETGAGIAAGTAAGVATMGLTRNPVSALMVGASADALGSEFMSQILERAGVKKRKTNSQRIYDLSTNTAFNATFGAAFNALSKIAGPVARKFKNAGQKLADNADADAVLARALIDDPESFNKTVLGLSVGGDKYDAVETVRELRRYISKADISVQREAFKNINTEIQKGITKSQKMLDSILETAIEKLPNPDVTLGDLDFNGMIQDLEQLRTFATNIDPSVAKLDFGASLTGKGEKTILRIFNVEREKLIKDALGADYPDYQKALKTVSRLESKFPQFERRTVLEMGRLLPSLADDDLIKVPKNFEGTMREYADAVLQLEDFESVISEYPLGLQEVNNLRKQFDKLARLGNRATVNNLTDRIGSEAYFLLAHRLREKVANKISEAKLGDAYRNAGKYYGLLRRLEPEVSAQALRQSPGGQKRQAFDAIGSIFSPSTFDQLEAGLGADFNMGGVERFAGEVLLRGGKLGELAALAGTAEGGFSTGFAAAPFGGAVIDASGVLPFSRPLSPEPATEVLGVDLSGLNVIEGKVPQESLDMFADRVRKARQSGEIDAIQARKLISQANRFQRLEALTPSGLVEAATGKTSAKKTQKEEEPVSVEIAPGEFRRSTSEADTAR